MGNFEWLKGILVGQLKIEEEKVTPRATLVDLEVDSLSAVELAAHLEEDHAVRVTDEQILAAVDVPGLLRLVSEASRAAT